MAVRKYCLKNSVNFTSFFHTRYDTCLKKRYYIPEIITMFFLKKFHNASNHVITWGNSTKKFLLSKGFANVVTLCPSRDNSIFYCHDVTKPINRKYPRLLYVGRIASEKNINDFLDLPFVGKKTVVGDGPLLKIYQQNYPHVIFKGYLSSEEIAKELNQADVFVMPSRAETLGLAALEAIYCGLPVAGYSINGLIDIVDQGVSGWLADDLNYAINQCLMLERSSVIKTAQKFPSTLIENFLKLLVPIK
ncbi:MAG: glycosyltransferase [Legionellales bacterium]|nr:glycosyltransferase [Legionellales bacterium]